MSLKKKQLIKDVIIFERFYNNTPGRNLCFGCSMFNIFEVRNCNLPKKYFDTCWKISKPHHYLIYRFYDKKKPKVISKVGTLRRVIRKNNEWKDSNQACESCNYYTGKRCNVLRFCSSREDPRYKLCTSLTPAYYSGFIIYVYI